MQGEAREAGRELDALVAERVMGYRRVADTTRDYDGVQHGGEFLVPPTIADDQLHNYLPPFGGIPFDYFVGARYSARIIDAWQVVERMEAMGYPFSLERHGAQWAASFLNVRGIAETVPLAICCAACNRLRATYRGREGRWR